MNDQRTETGALLRAGLDDVKRRAREAGKANAVAAVFTRDGIGVGYARMSPGGWELDASLRAKFEGGQLRDVRAELGWMW